MNKHVLIITTIMVAVWAKPALAASDVTLQLTAQEEITLVDDKGNKTTKLVEPKHVEPGDVVLYTISYNNKGKKPVENIVINDPVPADMTYIAGSARGKGTIIQFSVDGKNFATADKLMVKDDNGNMRLAHGDEYHHVRWTLVSSVPSKKTGSVSFKARVK